MSPTFRCHTDEDLKEEIDIAKAELDVTNRELIADLLIDTKKNSTLPLDRVDTDVLEKYAKHYPKDELAE